MWKLYLLRRNIFIIFFLKKMLFKRRPLAIELFMIITFTDLTGITEEASEVSRILPIPAVLFV